MQPFPFFTLAMVLTTYTAGLVGKKIIFFQGNTLKMMNTFNSTHPNCSQEILIYSPEVAIWPRRLASCINSKYWEKAATVIPGILNNKTKGIFSLEHVALNCSRINVNSSYNLWHATLKVSAATTTGHEPPFREVIFMLRCSGSNVRPDVTYLVKKAEPNKTSLTQKPTSAGTAAVTDLPLNFNLTTTPPSMPAHGTADHKNNLAMAIGIPVGITVAVLLGVAWACYQHRERIIIHCKDKHTALFSPKNSNIETTESIFN